MARSPVRPWSLLLLLVLCASLCGVPVSAQVLDNASLTIVGSINHCADSGSTDAYACSLTPAITAYNTATCYSFSANTANTGAATLNLNGLGAKTIVKMGGGITTALADGDIRAGQLVHACYDGTNFQMQSQVGNAGAGAGTVTATGGALSLNQLVLGAGGTDTKSLGTLGTTTTLLHGSAVGLPTFGAVDLATEVTGNLAVSHLNGGTGASSSTMWCGNGTWCTPAGGGNVSNTGTPTVGQLALWTTSTVVQGVTALPAANFPALTGDVTTSAASLTTVLTNIPTDTPLAGTLLGTNTTAPGTPSAGKVRVWTDTTDKRLHEKNDAGVTGTTVVADTGASNNFLTAISAAGVISKAQPAFSNLSGAALAAQLPSTTVNSVTNDTNVTGSITAQALTLGWTGTLAKARIVGTAMYNDQGNTITTGAQDFGSASSFIDPKAAGAAPTADGARAFDTTRKTPVWGSNGVATLAGVGLLCSGVAGSTNNAASGSGTDVDHTPTCTIPGNFLQNGKRLRACVTGTYTTAGTAPTILFTLKTGTTPIARASASGVPAGKTAWTINFCYRLTAETAPGGTASVRVTPHGILDSICCGDNINTIAQPVTLATNGNLVLTLASQWGSNISGNTWTLSDMTLEALN
jgi:hypothetical protein